MRLLIPLFSPATGTWGGLTRVIAVADAAQKAGHVVAFCASGYLEDELCRRGYLVHSMPAATMLGLPTSLFAWHRTSLTAHGPSSKTWKNNWKYLVCLYVVRAGSHQLFKTAG